MSDTAPAASPALLDLHSATGILARLERIPAASWHVRTRLILGTATFFDAIDLLAISYALPALTEPWKLTPQQIGSILSAAFVGQIIGALIAGWAAERFGRIAVVTVTVAVFGVMSIACAFAWDVQSMMIFRFIQGIGLGGEVPIASTYIQEITRAEGRGRFYLFYQLLFSCGIVCAGILGFFMVPNLGWQSMFYLGGVPAILALFLRRLLPESPRWLVLVGRLREADAVTTEIERSVSASGHALPPPVAPQASAATGQGAGNWTEMFRGIYRRRTLSVWAFWFCAFSTIYGLGGWLPSLYRTVFHLPLSTSLGYGLITSMVGICGSALCALLIDKVGRRPWFTVAFICGGATLLSLWIVGPSTPMILLVFVSIGSFFVSSIAQGLNLYTAEIYPTRMRAFASSVGGTWQRVAAALGPIVLGYLLVDYGLGSAFIYFGGIAIIGGFAAYGFTTETAGRVLEEVSP
jgi:putative MFS transporter